LCRQLKAARPNLRSLLMSGYVDVSAHPDLDAATVLSKPFTQAQLARRIRSALDVDLAQ
jgi:CheY-like chemotaxis protein